MTRIIIAIGLTSIWLVLVDVGIRRLAAVYDRRHASEERTQ